MGTCNPPCPGGAGAPLSAKYIASLLIGTDPGIAGVSARKKRTVSLTAIALAESGGRPGACNHYTSSSGPQQVYGLWQYSTIHADGGLGSCDPVTAASQAWALSSNGTNFGAWTRLGIPGNLRPDVILHRPQASKGYDDALKALNLAVTAGTAGLDAAAATFNSGFDPFGFLKSWGDAVVFLVKFITSPNTWIRVAEVIAGAILVVMGLLFLFSETKAGQSVAKAAPVAAMT